MTTQGRGRACLRIAFGNYSGAGKIEDTHKGNFTPQGCILSGSELEEDFRLIGPEIWGALGGLPIFFGRFQVQTLSGFSTTEVLTASEVLCSILGSEVLEKNSLIRIAQLNWDSVRPRIAATVRV